MKKLLVGLLVLASVALFGVTLTPSYFMNSEGDMIARANLLFEGEALNLEIDSEMDLVAAEFDVNAELTLNGVSGLYKFGVGYDSLVATPSIAFLYVTPKIGTDAIGFNLKLGTGDFSNKDFGKKLIGDFWVDNRDLSALGRFETSFILDTFKLDTGINAGYYLKDSSYEVSMDLGTKFFDWIYFDAKAVILPTFSWEFMLKAVLVF
jgi:hypothetical protein